MPTANVDQLMALWGIAECSDGFRKAQSPYSFAVRNFLPSLSIGSGGGSCQAPFGAQHVEHHRYGMFLPICTRLGLNQGGQVLRSPNYVHANAHHQQPISVAVAGNVVGSMLVLPLTSAIRILSLKNSRIAALPTITTAQVIFSSDLAGRQP